MKKHLILCGLLFIATRGFSAEIPEGFVKVTNDMTAKCVEYYTYQGTLYCSTKALMSSAVDPNIKEYETQNIVFDDRIWQAAWGKKADKEMVVEYVPMGDDINNWHELITSQYFSGFNDDATPKAFADFMIRHLRESGFKPIVHFIKETPDQVVFEFRIEKPASQAQDELQVIRKKGDSFYVLHYVIKQSDMGEKNRDKWLGNLLKSTIKE